MKHTLAVAICLTLLAANPVQAFECEERPEGAFVNDEPEDNDNQLATACGQGSDATGDYGTAYGAGATSVDLGVAVGGQASASTGAVGIGRSARGQGAAAIALGTSTIAAGTNSIALGISAQTSEGNALALGPGANVSAESGVALGALANVSGARSTAIGFLATAPQADTVILGAIAGNNNAVESSAVGIGTTAPIVPLHVSRADGKASILVEETIGSVEPRTLFMLANPGNTKFEIMNSDAMNSWAFTNSGQDFRISLQDSGVVEFRVDNAGNAELAGLLTENSDRHAKTGITPVNPDAILEKVVTLPIAEWSYRDTPRSRHIGPMAQDFHAAFKTGIRDTQLATLDVGGVAIASIQALEARNRKLEEEVQELKALVAALLPREQEQP